MLLRLLALLPFSLLYAVAWLCYLLLYYVARYRRDVVRANLANAFPEKSPAERRRLEKAFYQRLCQVALEIIKARRMPPEDFLERARITNPELLEQYSENFSKSVIVLTIHQGNWEWMLHGATTRFQIPIDPVYKPLHNAAVDKLIYQIRSQFGSRPLSMDESVKDIIRRRREFRIFVMVADQSPIRSERGYWTQFMNQEANFYLGAETIAKMTRFPVLFAQCRRRRTGHYEIEFKELARPPYDKHSNDITDRYVALAEQAIREEPESWLWSNRRWKRDRAREEAREQQAS
ncbi:lipid A biosynthesis (KDO)2-(lauroyl)-lipid IVA acyltransferase [Seongchinamella sediminis]|uniref:Lipid A biosynthesis (KDO)2-(Lauroyl)-lipid IVA acyltransferase n=1 Tax=Seongchinamella sediminis TaxID=2283635 RepID=A0A3L7DZ45_9GAMM|nr:lysophospholipid acyltransferase family protein [Seongchinamella sediminis]RLQ21939.1 lipid A biosynthesis (KDO)2-(lauroyl)-lipid IVA acyltransferase [Seongchinamella sediminis]